MNGNLKKLRELRALTQRDLAERAGIDPSTVNAIERMKRRANPRTTQKLAKALEISPELLVSKQMGLWTINEEGRD